MVRAFEGKVALVSGAAKGIGLATAARFAQDGADIVALDLPGADLAALTQAVEGQGRRLIVTAGDVSTPEAWDAALAATDGAYGGLDILVNNAGIAGPFAPIDRYPIEAFDRVMAVNLRGPFLAIRAATPMLKQRRGTIVNVASTAGLGGGRLIAGYTASKHALIGLTKLAAVELASHGVRVNAVCPAPTDTDMMKSAETGRTEAENTLIRRRFEADCPLGRYGEPAEIAAAIAFLAGADAGFVTGAILSVDGGVKAK